MANNFCTNCGSILEPGANTCAVCGHFVVKYETAPYKEDKTFGEIFFRSHGRLNRLRYFKRSMILLLVEVLLLMVLIAAFTEPSIGDDISIVGITLIMLVVVIFLPPQYMLTIRRLHDLNKSGWFCLLMLVPFVNNIFPFYLLLAPGTVGPNEYGADPLSN